MAETTRLREIYMTEELKRDMKTTRRVVATAKQLLGLEDTAELSRPIKTTLTGIYTFMYVM